MMDNLDDSSKKAQKDIFYKQQQQRLQHITLNKDLKADDLIKNILEKVDTDAKITKFYNAQNRNTYNYTSTASYSLPMPPCFHANVDIPNIYPKIWNLVKADNSLEFCDRDKLYQVLLLSQLASNVLAQLWSFVNRTLPGQLTKNELFVMLALVALIQSNSIDPQKELYSTTAIPIPFFTSLSEQEPFFKNGQTLSTAQNIVNITESSNSEKTLKNDKIDVLPIEEDFADFKCADLNIPVQDNTSLFNDTTSVDSNQIDTINLTPNKQSKDDDILSISNICDNLQDCSLFADKPKKDNSTTDIFMPICSPQECEPSEDDKYSSLRKLSINCLDGDEFGDFYSHSTENKCDKSINQVTNSLLENIPKESHKVISTKRKFLNACKQVMQKTFNILIVNHGEESVLEALSSKDGTNFAHDLHQVFLMATKIKSTLDILNNSNEKNACIFVFNEIEKKWNFILNIFKKSSINFNNSKEEISGASIMDSTSNNCIICSTVCLESSSLLFAGFYYHISCANFWLNYVDPSLPQNNFY